MYSTLLYRFHIKRETSFALTSLASFSLALPNTFAGGGSGRRCKVRERGRGNGSQYENGIRLL